MARRPANITYGLEDRPPFAIALILAAQHVVLILMFVPYPLVVASAAGFSPEATRDFVAATILAMGIGTILQCWRGYGSGYLLIQVPNPIQLPTLIHAGSAGGPALIAMIGLVSGGVQAAMGPILRPLRRLLPAEVCGVAVTMLGISLIVPGIERALELSSDRSDFHPDSLLVAATALALMLSVAIFTRGILRIFALPIGIAVGWVAAAAVGYHGDLPPVSIAALPWIDLPIHTPAFSFEPAYIPAIVLGAVITSIDTLGIMISMQRMNDADWRRVDLPQAARGLKADGTTSVISGLLGGMPTAVSSSSVGLAFATGATARVVGLFAGCIMVVVALCPRVGAAATMVPPPVLGSMILYSAAYLITSGMELILSRRLSERRVFVVGLSVIAGITLLAVPRIFHAVPEALEPIVTSPLSLSVIVALLLNLVFQIGISRRASLVMPADANPFLAMQEFLDRQGALWGARRDVIVAASRTAALAVEAIVESGLARGGVRLEAQFDETHLDVAIAYTGGALERPAAQPSPEALLGDEREIGRFVGWTLSQLSDSLELRTNGDLHTIAIRFDH